MTLPFRWIFTGIVLGASFLIFAANAIGQIQVVAASTEEPSFSAPAETLAPPGESADSTLATDIAPAESAPAKQEEAESSSDGNCEVSPRFPEAVYRWCDLITHYANENGLDPDLVAALIVQESGGKPDAYSRSGAVGLMQVMPRDGIAASFRCVNGPCFASRPSMVELYDPEFNIRYGTRMLAGLISKRGSVRDGLMAYGPMNVGYSYADKVLAIYERFRD
ncbi:lytic transglycosylase domain-containing protein [Anaerolinea sp.]|uniref:lytic transglycosylase domain-containing protein n=1 Tax=Anaerolinea sp. TaxID=1872519 RepID=UPI002ACD2CF9|nr:transglycosylase SLT domain-containing protein [Anaerolinea sp.]